MPTDATSKTVLDKTFDNPLLFDFEQPMGDDFPRSARSAGGPTNVILFAHRPQQEELDNEALQLRSMGYSYRQIASRLEIHLNTAYHRVQRAAKQERREFPEEKHDVRDFEMMKLERLEQAVMPAALKGDLSAVKTVLRIMTIRLTLLKIEGPTSDEERGARGEENDEGRMQNAEQVSESQSEPETSSEPEASARDPQHQPEAPARDTSKDEGKMQNPEASRQDHRMDKMESSGTDPVNPVDPVKNPSNVRANSANAGANRGANSEKSEKPRNPAKPGTPKDPTGANTFSPSADARTANQEAPAP